MKQPEDTVTVDWLGGDVASKTGNHQGRGRRAGQRCGAYRGAVRMDSEEMRRRASTGKSQAEFAALCGISERTLRSWETGKDVSWATYKAIASKLDLLAPRNKPRQPVQYRDAFTGETWSGRGLMPKWLKVKVGEQGMRLDDFAPGGKRHTIGQAAA